VKCSAIDRNGQWHNVYKNPKTDPSKASKGGRFNLIQNGKDFATIEIVEGAPIPSNNALETILEDGKLMRDQLSRKFAPSLLLTTTISISHED